MKRVLIVAYAFPPVGGAAVQRPAKFAKYLPQHGWNVSVLTASNPSVPVYDESLLEDIPAQTVVVRSRSLEPSYAVKNAVSASNEAAGGRSITASLKRGFRKFASALLQPDPQILWLPLAIRQGSTLLRSEQHQAILATAPPFSSLLIGALLSVRFRIPLILDYRDEWGISNKYLENHKASRFSAYIQRKMQGFALRRAKAVLATTKSSAEAIELTAETLVGTLGVDCIYNGYDGDDFRKLPPTLLVRTSFRITYSGTLWNLTSIEPFVLSIETLQQEGANDVIRMLTVCLFGRRTSVQDRLVDRLRSSPLTLEVSDYLPHKTVVGELMRSDCLLLLLADKEEAGRVVPAKVFEYMASGKPILAIAPQGEVWELLKDYPLALLHTPCDVRGIANSIRDLANRNPGAESSEGFDVERYSRRRQSQQLAAILDRAAGDKAPVAGT